MSDENKIERELKDVVGGSPAGQEPSSQMRPEHPKPVNEALKDISAGQQGNVSPAGLQHGGVGVPEEPDTSSTLAPTPTKGT